MGSTVDWCPGFNDQLCIKTNQPGDGGSVEVHANFNVSPTRNDDGSYNWSVGFNENPEVITALLDDTPGGDPIMLKYAIINNTFTFSDNPNPDNPKQYIKYGGSCHKTEDDSCRIVKHQYPDGMASWDSETRIASGTIEPGYTLIWWLHVNLRYEGEINTSFALPCANSTHVDPDLQVYNNNNEHWLSFPFPSDLTFVDPVDGTYVFDHLSQVHGWGWQFYYTAPTESCGEIPPETPDCEDLDGCVPECIPPPEVDFTDPYCTTEIGIVAGQHIPVGTATLKMKEGQKEIDEKTVYGYYYNVHVNINAGFVGQDLNKEDRDCSIVPREPCESDGDCENVKVQSGVFPEDKISKLPLGKYADKCCLPQDVHSLETDILIAAGFVPFDSDFPLSIHLDLQVNCEVVEVVDGMMGTSTDCSSETAFALKLPDNPNSVEGNCPLVSVEEGGWLYDIAKHGWGKAIMIDTSAPPDEV